MLFNRRFSSSSCFSRTRSLVSRPPYFERHELERRLADGVRPAQLGGFRTRPEFLEDPDDLGFRKSGLSHVVSFEAEASESTYLR